MPTMPTQLFMEERRRIILEELKKHGRVSVRRLSEVLNVSAVTIRQDLRALETDGLLERTHGGAVPPTSSRKDQPELSFDLRRGRNYDEKEALGKAAAEMVDSGFAIALDASTTVCSIIPHLGRLDGLTVVTNNLLVAEMLLPNPRVTVLLPGGRLRRDSYSVVGNPATLPEINLNIGFVSAWGISAEAGLTEVSEDEMGMKQALLNKCPRKIVLVDSSKWGKVAPYTYGQPDDMDEIITTSRTSKELMRGIDEANLRVIPVNDGV